MGYDWYVGEIDFYEKILSLKKSSADVPQFIFIGAAPLSIETFNALCAKFPKWIFGQGL